MGYLEIETNSWSELKTIGKQPKPRTIHSVCVIPTEADNKKMRVFVFGGGSENNRPIDDSCVYCLDLGLAIGAFEFHLDLIVELNCV